ncbi:MAG: hypothetical protein KDI64_14910, partial [Candidatus Accumulibacter sp.]|nr:hypothetical protein [Accumulibacter sp.]
MSLRASHSWESCCGADGAEYGKSPHKALFLRGIKIAAAATGSLHVAGDGLAALAGKRASFSRARLAASRGRQPDERQGSVAPTVSIMP